MAGGSNSDIPQVFDSLKNIYDSDTVANEYIKNLINDLLCISAGCATKVLKEKKFKIFSKHLEDQMGKDGTLTAGWANTELEQARGRAAVAAQAKAQAQAQAKRQRRKERAAAAAAKTAVKTKTSTSLNMLTTPDEWIAAKIAPTHAATHAANVAVIAKEANDNLGRQMFKEAVMSPDGVKGWKYIDFAPGQRLRMLECL